MERRDYPISIRPRQFRGAHGQAAPRYEQLLGYMHEYSLTPAGPSREIALIDDIISDDPATYVTQITVPVSVPE